MDRGREAPGGVGCGSQARSAPSPDRQGRRELAEDHSIAVKASETQTPRSAASRSRTMCRCAEVAPLATVFVTAVEGGQVEQVLALDGSEVAAGAPLARLANSQLKLAVVSKEAEIAGRLGDVSGQELALQKAQADRERELAQANYDMQKARRELDRRQILHDKGIESDVALKTAADEAAYTQARVASLEAGAVRETRMSGDQHSRIRALAARLDDNLSVVQASLDALVVKAPMKGRLTNFVVQPGQPLKAGETVGQVDLRAPQADGGTDEFYLGRVAVGQSATADLNGRSPLTVSRVLPQVVQGHSTWNWPSRPGAHGAAPGPDPRRAPHPRRHRPAVTLPNEAWLEGSGGAFVFVMRPDGLHADRRAITVRRRNPQQWRVASGLSPGDRVVSSSYAGLRPTPIILR